MAIVPLLEYQMAHGYRPVTIERYLRVFGDSLRRIAETGGDAWNSEVSGPSWPGLQRGRYRDGALRGVGRDDRARRAGASSRCTALHQAQAWTTNIIAGIEKMLAAAGLHSRLERPPAMCFLDITGYTRLTQERGDAAAAELAEQLGRLVQRTSVARRAGRSSGWATA